MLVRCCRTGLAGWCCEAGFIGLYSWCRPDYVINGAVTTEAPSGASFVFPLPMNRVAVFVDAGYVFAQGSVLLAGRKLPRGETSLDHVAAIASLATFAERVAGVALLRVYWYDGTSTGPTAQHLTLAHLDNVKVRLGFVNSVGEQKGVDSLIVTDMITLARNRAICDAVLVSGDEDLRVGVQQAQEFGVRVHLVGIKPSRGSQSLFLLQEADTTQEWTDAEVASFLSCKPKPTSTSGSLPRGATATAKRSRFNSPGHRCGEGGGRAREERSSHADRGVRWV